MGSYLPAIGGVTTHISRLAEALNKDGLLDCVFSTTNPNGFVESRFIVKNAFYPRLRYVTLQSLFWFIKYFSKKNLKIIHFHGHPVWESPTLLLLLLFKKKVVYTIHDQIILSDIKIYPGFLISMLKKSIKNRYIHWIAVNPIIKTQLESLVIDCTNISVIPAYLPALEDNNSLEFEIEDFINLRSKIVSIYAHSIRKINGKDMYGIDLALKSVALVKKHYMNIGIIICIPNTPNKDLLDNYFQIIKELQLFNNVLFFLKPLNNPLQLWRKSDIVLRPTLTDGDSLVVREALVQGTFVIASDVVNRPDKVILFKSENIEDLYTKIVATLSKTRITNNEPPFSNYELIKNIYSNL